MRGDFSAPGFCYDVTAKAGGQRFCLWETLVPFLCQSQFFFHCAVPLLSNRRAHVFSAGSLSISPGSITAPAKTVPASAAFSKQAVKNGSEERLACLTPEDIRVSPSTEAFRIPSWTVTLYLYIHFKKTHKQICGS